MNKKDELIMTTFCSLEKDFPKYNLFKRLNFKNKNYKEKEVLL